MPTIAISAVKPTISRMAVERTKLELVIGMLHGVVVFERRALDESTMLCHTNQCRRIVATAEVAQPKFVSIPPRHRWTLCKIAATPKYNASNGSLPVRMAWLTFDAW